ncbi:MAG: hypothetical protein M3R27_14405 [Bacteroidota bacterium]|nr:hypothetical protein [Bacteroidota bacterium]
MNYEEQLLKEHSRNNTDFITKTIGGDAVELKKILGIIYHSKAPLPQRAAWLLVTVNNKHPELLKPYIGKFIETVLSFQVDAVKRNMLAVLAAHEIPEKLQGKLINVCFELILSPLEPVAVKTFSLQCIANVAKHHPELIHELKAVIQDQLPKTTAAFHARSKNILKGIK